MILTNVISINLIIKKILSSDPALLSPWNLPILGSGAREAPPLLQGGGGRGTLALESPQGAQHGLWEPAFLAPIYLQILCPCPRPA